ncbi:DUF2931 family protein [Chryseobacterium sp. RU33C]|uniref:DUF2931 family protein n=1 Tax=Chryseobacterium sp. RU33C TaxID=1907398 RepID=UPI00147BCF3E|nr:DUF2931 family protein [Chryseobacterium sp. RU33C]
MKESLKIRLIKGTPTLLFWMLMISLSLLQSCNKNKYRWEAGISAPSYYPAADVRVGFDNAGNGSLTSFDPGWGQTYGAVVGEKWKDAPKEVSIHYNSGAENYTYDGKISLPQEKIRDLFNEYNLDDEDNLGHLVVGMAPGGWIRVWFQALDKKADDYVNIEVAKARLKGSYDDTADVRYKTKNFENWGKYYTYWQLHGIPYEAWAENEKEYNIIFDFDKPNPKNEVTDPQYSSLDGTLYYRTPVDSLLKRKLPVDLVAVWKSKNSNIYYDTHVTFPKNFSKIIEDRKLSKVVLSLQIEEDDQYGVIYLIGDKGEEKLLRFKTYPSKDKILGNSDFSQEVEYFIQ